MRGSSQATCTCWTSRAAGPFLCAFVPCVPDGLHYAETRALGAHTHEQATRLTSTSTSSPSCYESTLTPALVPYPTSKPPSASRAGRAVLPARSRILAGAVQCLPRIFGRIYKNRFGADGGCSEVKAPLSASERPKAKGSMVACGFLRVRVQVCCPAFVVRPRATACGRESCHRPC